MLSMQMIHGGRSGIGFVLAFLLVLFAVGGSAVGADDRPGARLGDDQAAFFAAYCVKCHGPEKQKGKVRLDTLSFDLAADTRTADTWQKVLNALNAGDMPPLEQTQPPADEKAALLEELSVKMVAARQVLADQGGAAPVMRRLNRREYRNTISDLLGVAIDVKHLPDDSGQGGFDTAGASLFFSPDQFERYLKLGRQALDEAIIERGQPAPQRDTVRVELEQRANRQAEKFYHGYREQFERHLAWLASDGERPATAFGFLDEPRARRARKLYFKNTPHHAAWRSWPGTDEGVYLSRLQSDVDLGFNESHPPGEYLVRIRLGATKDAPVNRRFVDFGVNVDVGGRQDFKIIRTYQVMGTADAPQVIEIPVTLGATGPRGFVIREMRPDYEPREKWKRLNEALAEETDGPSIEKTAERLQWIERRMRELISRDGELSDFIPRPAIWVDWVEIEGPLVKSWPPPAHQRIFFEGDDAARDAAYARRIITRFAERAMRGRQPDDAFVDRLVGIYQQHTQSGATFEDAVKEALAVVLASPSFLYLSESVAERDSNELTDLELATRLSYFLWSSPPDEALLTAARDGSLRKPEVLREQVERMLERRRRWELVTGFTHQWLDLDRIDLFQFDQQRYPDFNESMKVAAAEEVYHFVDTILRENRSAANLLKSDFVVVNGLMAEYYGIEGVRGEAWRTVKLPPSSPRGGLTGTACILAMGSDGHETNPVERGAWVLRKLLNDPPPPAPPNVPQLSRVSEELLSHRERLAAHRQDAQCLHCHRKIDPIGFGLENFDAAGKWREQETFHLEKDLVRKLYPDLRGKAAKAKREQTRPIDAGGELHRGPAFDDYFELRDILAARVDEFSRGLTESLLAYALGRPIGFSDEQLVAQLHETMKKDDYRLRTLIHAIVQSKAFATK